MPSCILYQNFSSDIILLDIPRSIEQAQGALSSRLISSLPLEHPYPALEPKTEKARNNLRESTLDELLLQRHLELALVEASHGLGSDKTWCLPRITGSESNQTLSTKKRKRLDQISSPDRGYNDSSVLRGRNPEDEPVHLGCQLTDTMHYYNPHATCSSIPVGHDFAQIPPKSTALQGDIASTLHTFTRTAPRFKFIVLDPPWPNRSARRKKSYGIAYGTSEVKSLLSLLPVQAHLAGEGLVAVWVTNKSAFREMLLDECGLFEQWGVRLVEEWVWLKVTAGGEPICPIDSKWRKPYEVLLIGRKAGQEGKTIEGGEVKRRIIIGVPDIHSRKPNLSIIIEQFLGIETRTCEALEIFTRNLTTGWWGWGNEALKFQMSRHWQENE